MQVRLSTYALQHRYGRRITEIACVVVIASGNGCGSHRDQDSHSPVYRNGVLLREQFAWTVSEFGSMAHWSEKRLLTWDDRHTALSVITPERRISLTLRSVPLAAGRTPEGTMEVIDVSGQVYRIDPRGSATPLLALIHVGRPLAAARLSSGWQMVLLDSLGARAVDTYDVTGALRWHRPMPPVERNTAASQEKVSMVPLLGGTEILASEAPFTLRTFDRDGAESPTVPIAQDKKVKTLLATNSSPEGSSSVHRQWRAVGMVPLDSLLLITLADLNSNRRLILVVSPKHGVRSVRALDVPMALIGRDDANGLYAARRTDRFEIVYYSWAWGSQHTGR